MIDRNAQYPGRVKLTPVSGQTNIYDMELADSPRQVGTPLNKATFLTDATAEKIRASTAEATAPETVNEALSMLAGSGTIVLDGVYSSYGATHSAPTNGLSSARYGLAGASVGNYALFAGGYTTSASNVVNAYDTSLTRTTASNLSASRQRLAGASVGNYALFAGGVGTSSKSAVVNAYNTSLTRSTPTSLGTARSYLAGASVGNYAIFAGGLSGTNDTASSAVDCYNTSLTRSAGTALSAARDRLGGASVGNYALFAGGGSDSTVVDAYDTSLTHSTASSGLSTGRKEPAGGSIGSYALFGGGYTSSNTRSNVVDAYNTSLTRSTPTALSEARSALAAAGTESQLFFAGGLPASGYSNVVDAYDTSLTRTTPTALDTARSLLAGASVGGYALFAGGSTGSTSAVVDAYSAAYTTAFKIPAMSFYKFDGYHNAEQFTKDGVDWSSTGTAPLSGYIKTGGIVSGLIS